MSNTLKPPPLDRGYRRCLIRLGPLILALRQRSLVLACTTALGIGLICILSLGMGTYAIAPGDVVQVLLGGGEVLDRTIVREWRLPRGLAAITMGALLGVAGALFQTVTRNPLASPDILGLSNGAFTGMLLTLVLISSSWPALTVGALVGGLFTATAIWLLSLRGGIQGFRLIVTGIGVSAMLASVNTWLLLQIELNTALFASAWGTGTLNGVTIGPVVGALLCAAPVAIVIAVISPRLRQLELGDDMAAASGIHPGTARTVALLCGVGLVSAATTVAGPVAFIALAAPQVARRIARTPYLSLTLSALAGAFLLLVSDSIAQHVLPVTLPVGVVTVSLGGAYLVAMIVLEIRRRA